MTVRTTDLGGTDWSDGEVLDAADQNDTFGAVTTHRKQFSDATERLIQTAGWNDTGTEFTLSAPVGSLIIGFYLNAELTDSAATDTVSINIKITGTNLGTIYAVTRASASATSQQPVLDGSESGLISTNVYAYGKVTAMIPAFKILDASTTLTIRGYGNGANAAYVKNITIDVIYVEKFKED